AEIDGSLCVGRKVRDRERPVRCALEKNATAPESANQDIVTDVRREPVPSKRTEDRSHRGCVMCPRRVERGAPPSWVAPIVVFPGSRTRLPESPDRKVSEDETRAAGDQRLNHFGSEKRGR